MILSALRDRTWDFLGDDGTHWPVAKIVDYLNDAEEAVARRLRLLTARIQPSSYSGSNREFWALPATTIDLIEVMYRGKILPRVTAEQAWNFSTNTGSGTNTGTKATNNTKTTLSSVGNDGTAGTYVLRVNRSGTTFTWYWNGLQQGSPYTGGWQTIPFPLTLVDATAGTITLTDNAGPPLGDQNFDDNVTIATTAGAGWEGETAAAPTAHLYGPYGPLTFRIYPADSGAAHTVAAFACHIVRKPTTALTTGNLNASPEIPEAYHIAMVYHAVASAYNRDFDLRHPEKARAFLDLYQQALGAGAMGASA